MNGCAPGVTLIEKLKATWKWVILQCHKGKTKTIKFSSQSQRTQDNPVNQSKLQSNCTCSWSKVQENICERVAIGFGYKYFWWDENVASSHSLINIQNKLLFDIQLKTTLFSIQNGLAINILQLLMHGYRIHLHLSKKNQRNYVKGIR